MSFPVSAVSSLPPDAVPEFWTDLAQSYGLLVALLIFFVWEASKRERRLVGRIETVEDFQRDTLTHMVTDSTTVIRDYTQASRGNSQIMRRLEKQIELSW